MLESRNFYLNENKNSISKTKKNTQIKSINRSGSQLDLTSKLSSSNPKQNNNRELNNLKKNKSSVFSSSDNNKYDILLNSKYKLKTNSVFSFIEKTIIKYKTVKDNLNKMIIDEIPTTTESLKLKNLQLVERLKIIAAEKNITIPQLSLAWLLSKDDDISPLVGASRRITLLNSLKSIDIVLNSQDIERIENAIPQNEIAGSSFPSPKFRNGKVVW